MKLLRLNKATLFIITFSASTFCMVLAHAQTDTLDLNLDNAIVMANDSSLQAFKGLNVYLVSYWQYRNYEISKRPFLNLYSSPLNYNRSISKQFNPQDTSYNYFAQQNLNSSLSLSIEQSLPFTGGSLYIDSDLDRLENYGNKRSIQYSSTPIRIGIIQPIFGFNHFKWDKKIEPLKFEKAKQEYIQFGEDIAIKTVGYFFDLAATEMRLQIASMNAQNADTLFQIGSKRFEIGSVSKTELLSLKLDVMNTKNSLRQARLDKERAQARFNSFLGLDNSTKIKLVLPDQILDLFIDSKSVLDASRKNNPTYLDFVKQKLEAERDVEKTRIESRFNASLQASIGYNHFDENIEKVYSDMLDQERVNLSLKIPLIDWKLKKGKYNLAQKQMEITLVSLKQAEMDFEQEIQMTVAEFNLQGEMIKTAYEAAQIATIAYEASKERFKLGKEDVNSLNSQLNRKDNALLSYIRSLETYWKYYYLIRKVSLYDFKKNTPLMSELNKIMGR